MSNKRKRQDNFQKVKLRVGRKKPRSENATDTGFRTKGIHVPEQLAEEEGSLFAGSRKLSIKDLLSQMHHYSPGVKQNALFGLKELLSFHPSVIDFHLSSIVSEVAAVFTDKDAIVRSAAVRFLRCLASKIPADQIAPFFPLVSAHLSSAMTHIVEGIQEDSLKVLDVLLDEYPALLIDRSSMLLKNFVELISHQQLSRGVKSGDTFSAWTLSVNLNRNLTSQQWRLNVLMRLRKLLHSLASVELEGDGLLEQRENTQSCRAASDIIWEEHTSGQQQIQVYEHGGTNPWVTSPFRLRFLGGFTCVMDEGLTSAENLKGFIEMIIPLLIECWVEASPTQISNATPGNLLEPESHQLMQQVLSIIYLLWRLAEKQDKMHKMESWLRVNYLDDFKHHFMSHFPYSLLETTKHKKKNPCRSSKHGTVSLNNLDHLLLNLTLCDIMVSLANASTLHLDSGWLTMIRKFVTETLVDGWKLNKQQLSRLLGVTWRLMLVQQNKVASEKLIRAVYVLYQQRDLVLPIRTMLLKFFSKVYQKEDFCPHLRRSRSKVLSRWLAGLPLQLVQLGSRNTELSVQLINTIHAAAARSNKALLHSLQASACEIYDPQDGTLVLLPAELQKPLVYLLYFVPCISGKLLACLHHCCINGRLSSGLTATLIGIVHTRSPFAGWCYVQDSQMRDVDYFSFLFSTLAGFSEEKLALLQGSKNSPHLCRTQVSPVGLYLTNLDHFVHHWAMTETVCYSLSTVPARSQCYDLLQSAISKHLAVLSIIPDSTAGSILYAISKLQDHSALLSDDIQKFLASCCSSLLFFLMTLEKQEPEHVQKREMLWESCVSLLGVLPRVLKLMLQSLQVSRVLQEELPIIAQLIRHLLQHTQLRSQMIMNAVLVQQIVQSIMSVKTGEVQEQWLTDLHYCFNIYVTAQPQGAAAVGALC